ncbi:hypothetical protein [Clostridium estertheticum]|uniref:hypothetical protein n=1 Tax=Clostridium estertheticum TaxID=238834 RepID=UPI001C0AAD65|nr:hypothetical protein [Clostridium estertheticum]MBU3186550.1 hypothetical protein [Clostridium estertheticum]
MKFRLLVNDEDNLAQKGDIIELYSLEDVRNYPGVSAAEIIGLEDIIKESSYNIVGFIKSKYYTEKHVSFVQVYDNEIGFITEK